MLNRILHISFVILVLFCIEKAQATDTSKIRNKFIPKADSTKIKSAKSKFLTKNQILKPSIKITSEARASNIQNPWQLAPANYARMRIEGSFSAFGIPLTGGVFLTTENGRQYIGNSFNIGFDRHTYEQQIRRKIQDSLDQVQGLVPSFDDGFNLSGYGLKQIEERKLAAANKLKNMQQVKQKHVLDLEKQQQRLDGLKSKGDSLSAEYQQAKDSLEKKKELVKDLSDKAEKYKAKADSVNSQYQLYKTKLDSLAQFSPEILTDGYSPEQIQNMKEKMLQKHINQDPRLKHLNRIRSFNIGQVTPYLSPFTLDGVLLRGINAGYEPGKFAIDLIGGKTVNNTWMINPDDRFRDDRIIAGTKFSYSPTNTGTYYVTLIGSRTTRDSLIPDYSFNPEASVYAIGMRQSFLKKFDFHAEWAHMLQDKYVTQYQEISGKYSRLVDEAFMLSAAIDARLNYNVSSNTKLYTRFRQISPNFISPGAPFIVTDIREIEAGINQYLFKKRISADVTAKLINDNLLGLKPVTNRIKGIGAQVQTMFENIPNVILLYQPYQQGNNHPNPLLRSFTQSSVFQATGIYQKTFKHVASNYMFSYTRSNMYNSALGDSGNVLFQLLSATASHTINKQYQFSTTYARTFNDLRTGLPSSNSVNVRFKRTGDNKIDYLAGFTYLGTGNESYHTSLDLGLGLASWKKISILAESSIGKVRNLWGYDKKTLLTGNLSVSYNLW